VSWGIFSAAECGAPHQRKRVFILAHSNSERGQLSHWGRLTAEQVPVGNGAAWRDVWPSRPGQPQHAWEPPRVVGNARGNGRRQDQQGRESKGRVAADGAGESMGNATESRLSFSGGQSGPLGQPRTQSEPERSDESLGNAEDRDSRRNALQLRQGQEQHRGTGGSECDGRRQTQPSLGRDTDGSASGLDYAELCTACDNRTDELRLLGNGVVPATAELAFRTLINEIQIAAAS
jgi:site-specific DNA-cytosine methylase